MRHRCFYCGKRWKRCQPAAGVYRRRWFGYGRMRRQWKCANMRSCLHPRLKAQGVNPVTLMVERGNH